MDLYRELMRLVHALDDERLDYVLVGALALAVHGVARATTDIDIMVRPEQAGRILELARRLGFQFEADPMSFHDGMEIRRISRIDRSETLTLDLILLNENLAHAWDSMETVETDDGPLKVVSRDALIRMKITSGRTRDLADIERLREIDR